MGGKLLQGKENIGAPAPQLWAVMLPFSLCYGEQPSSPCVSPDRADFLALAVSHLAAEVMPVPAVGPVPV